MCSGNTVTVLRPGHYTSPLPSGFLSGETYMRSGVYYFDQVGPMYVGGSSSASGTLIGGQPSANDHVYMTDPSACPGLADPPGSGTGVEIILGGNSSLQAQSSNSAMELFSRFPATPDGSTPGISIYQVQQSDAAAGWNPSTYVNIEPDLYNAQVTNPDLVHVGVPESSGIDNTTNLLVSIHGMIYAPAGNVELTEPTTVSFPIAPGGADVYALDAESTAVGTEAGTSAPPPAFGYFDITATAKGVNGDKAITSHAVVYLDYAIFSTTGSGPWGNQGNNTTAAVIYSWRTCTQAPAPAAAGTCSSG
jgi:hypothetical protein